MPITQAEYTNAGVKKVVNVQADSSGNLCTTAAGGTSTVKVADSSGSPAAEVSDANTSRAVGSHVLSVQHVDAAGKVPAADDLTACKTALQIIDDWDSSDNCKVDINAQTLTALKVSKDTSANATGNRIFVAGNIDQLNGNTIAVNGGAKGTGVQTVTLATDDPAVTSLAILDDWDDGSDHCRVVQAALQPGQDTGNDWTKVKIEENATYYPAVTSGTTVTSSATTILGAAIEVGSYSDWQVVVKNTGAAALTACYVEGSANGSDFYSLVGLQDASETVAVTLAAAASAPCGHKPAGACVRYIRARATCGTSTTVDAYLTCKK